MIAAAGRIRRGIGVDVGAALDLVGALVRYLALAFLFPAAVAVGYDEPAWPFLAAGAITAGLRWRLEATTQGKERVGVREGLLELVPVIVLFTRAYWRA